MTATTLERIDKARPKFVIGEPDECWPWLGVVGADGYGRIQASENGTNVLLLAHRLTYRLLVGRIPATYQLDHLCRNRRCVNPAHLEVVTNRENALRRPDVVEARTRNICPRGHVMDAENIYVKPNGSVRCRTCKREDAQRFKERNPGYFALKAKERRARERGQEGS